MIVQRPKGVRGVRIEDRIHSHRRLATVGQHELELAGRIRAEEFIVDQKVYLNGQSFANKTKQLGHKFTKHLWRVASKTAVGTRAFGYGIALLLLRPIRSSFRSDVTTFDFRQ